MPEQILDIGIGGGGSYIADRAMPGWERIGIDIQQQEMTALREHYPMVIPAVANGERLPFKTNTFSRIEIVLPCETLMSPGLQTDYEETHADGWYPEFQRVLIPQGTLIIYGDLLVDPKQVQQTSKKFFDVQRMTQLTESELQALGTETVSTVMAYGRYATYFNHIGRKWEDTLVTIELRSKKII